MKLNRLLFKGSFVRRPQFEGAVLALGKSKVTLVFSILALYMVQFGPDARVNLAPNFGTKTAPSQ